MAGGSSSMCFSSARQFKLLRTCWYLNTILASATAEGVCDERLTRRPLHLPKVAVWFDVGRTTSSCVLTMILWSRLKR